MPAQNLSDDMRPREIAVSVADATDTLTAAGIADARVDAELLLAHVMDVGRGELQAAALRGDTLDEASDAHFRDLVARRASREPLQHITGTAPFRHLELRVGPGVFVPRPETETLVQIASLIDLRLFSKASKDATVDGMRLRCEAPKELVKSVADAVSFDLRQYGEE